MMLDVLVIVQTLPSSNHINARYQGCQLGANANAEAARAPKQQTTRAPCFHTPYKSRMDRWMLGRKIVIGCEPYVQRNKSVRFGTKLPQLQCRPCGQKWTTIEKIKIDISNRHLQLWWHLWRFRFDVHRTRWIPQSSEAKHRQTAIFQVMDLGRRTRCFEGETWKGETLATSGVG